MGWGEIHKPRSRAIQETRTVAGVKLVMVGVSEWATPDGVWVFRDVEGLGWYLGRTDRELVFPEGAEEVPVRSLARGVRRLLDRGLIGASS